MVLAPATLAPTPAPTVLLLRGLSREQCHWGAFLPLLSQQLNQAVLCFDFAGCGALYRQQSPATIQGLCQSVRAQWLTQRSNQAQVHLVAMSLGGMLALDWALNWPDEVASISLINSSARPLSPFYQRLRWQAWLALAKLVSAGPTRRERHIMTLTSAIGSELILKQWQRWQQQRPVSHANMLRQLYAASRFYLPAAPQCPVLVLSSVQDLLVAPHCSTALAQFCQATHIQHDWAGHDIALDDPQWLSAKISAFVLAQMSSSGNAKCGLPAI